MEKIYSILEDIRPDSDFRGSTDFIGDVLLDSFDIMTLVAELEAVFSIKVDNADIVPENFVSVAAMAVLVSKSGGLL